MTLEVECHRCGYAWDYTGSSDYYASCPQCKTSVPIEGGAPSGGSDEADDPAGVEPADTPSDGDLERLSARVEELETTASELHGVIETMMSRVTELERRHTAVTTVQDGGGVGGSTASTGQPSRGSGARDGRSGGAARSGGTASERPGSPSEETDHRSDDGERAGGQQPDDGVRQSSAATQTNTGRRGDRGQNGASGRASSDDGGPSVEPTPDEDGNYDYVCPSCDGPLSGHPDACIHCGTAFTW